MMGMTRTKGRQRSARPLVERRMRKRSMDTWLQRDTSTRYMRPSDRWPLGMMPAISGQIYMCDASGMYSLFVQITQEGKVHHLQPHQHRWNRDFGKLLGRLHASNMHLAPM